MNKLLSTLFACLLVVVVQAQSVEDLLKPVTHTYAIKNVTIVPKPGAMIEGGTIIIKDGLIHAVGKNVSIPANAKILEADSMYVYAGFIDALSNIGIPQPKPDNSRERPRGEIRANPPYEMAGIMPHAEAADMISAEDKDIEAFRKIGITAVQTAPYGGMLRGQTAVVILAGEQASDMILIEEKAMVGTFEDAGQVFPATIMGVMTKYRELFGQARQVMAHQEAYEENPAMVRPDSDEALESIAEVIEGEMMMLMVAPGIKDLYRAMTLERDMDVDFIMANVKEGWRMVDQLKASGKPVLVSTDLPKELKEEKKKDEDEEAEEMDEEAKALMKRKKETYDSFVGQAATFAEAGIPFAFSTMGTKASDLRGNLQRMIKAGLTEETALAALTTTPAEMLGVSNVLGTVEKGKIANLVIADKPYFEEGSNVRMVIADGQVFEFEAKKKKSGNKSGEGIKPESLAGKWSYTIEVPGQTTTGTMALKSNGGGVEGTISSDQMGTTDMKDVALDGNTLTFSMNVDIQGQSMTLDYSLDFSEDTFEGNVSVGSFGSFDISGAKIPE